MDQEALQTAASRRQMAWDETARRETPQKLPEDHQFQSATETYRPLLVN